MNITFDKKIKQRVWQAINSNVKNKTCPFCGSKITGKNFVGAAWIKDQFRVFDGNILCLIAFSDTMEAIEEFGHENFIS